jgi:hypothetical protein
VATQKILAKGTVIKSSTTSGGTYTAISQVVSVQPPNVSPEMIPQPELAQRMTKERPASMEAGKVNVQVYHDPTDATHADLMAAMVGTTPNWLATKRWFKIELLDPDTGSLKATCSFSAWVSNFEPDQLEVGGYVVSNFELTLDDVPVWA